MILNKAVNIHVFLRIILFCFIFIGLSSCSLFKDIKINAVKDISPSIENKAIIINTSVEVKNPNFYRVAIKSTDLQVFLDDKELGNIELLDKVLFKKKTTDTYALKLKMKLVDGALFTILRNVFKKEVTLTFKGKIKGAALGIPKSITINETKTIDANLLKNLTN
jgi:LEA14-like dessication related protein